MTRPGGQDLLQTAQALLRERRVAEAEQVLRQLVQAQPDHGVALHQLGLLAHQARRAEDALGYLSRAATVLPRSARLRADLANALAALGRRDEAIAALRVATELEPTSVEWLGRLALLLESTGRIDEARDCYRRAEPLIAGNVDALSGGAGALGRMGFLDDAVHFCRKALAIDPAHAGANSNMGQAHALLGDVDAAVASFRAAARRGSETAWHNLLFHVHFHPAYDAERIYAEHRAWAAATNVDALAQQQSPAQTWANVDRDPERRLRVGYVSANFRTHPVMRLLEPVLARHDRARFEVVCYASGTQPPDAMTAAIRGHVAAWRECGVADDARVAEQIRRDGIDVLVDLSLHMGGNRLGVFARRAAPVQVTWLGYPGTSGLRAMDYRLSDPHLDPADRDDGAVYSERTVRLPHSFWPYHPPAGGPPVNALPAFERGHVTFASFNNPLKFNPGVYDAFARILAAVPRSRLLLLNNNSPAAAARMVQLLGDRGVAPDRVEVLPRAPLPAYLAYHHRADVVLDPFPYPGHTTTLDALWMGVPVVTLAGGPSAPAAARGGQSILTNVALPELIANDVDAYINLAVALAQDVARLAELRATLRQRLERCPICDVETFTRDVERAYRQMWDKWCIDGHA